MDETGCQAVPCAPPRLNQLDGGRPETYEVKIREVENGFVCGVGCKTFVATNWAELSGKLSEYFADPSAARKKYCRN